MIENFIALVVSTLLSIAGLSTKTEGSFILVPSLNHKFIVTLSCADFVGIALQTFMYVFIVWGYVTANRYSVKRKTYLTMGLVGFSAFFFVNILRIFTEIYLVGRVYSSVYLQYIQNWQSFEAQIGMGLMFATISILTVISLVTTKIFCRPELS
jgi:hypothetical protein